MEHVLGKICRWFQDGILLSEGQRTRQLNKTICTRAAGRRSCTHAKIACMQEDVKVPAPASCLHNTQHMEQSAVRAHSGLQSNMSGACIMAFFCWSGISLLQHDITYTNASADAAGLLDITVATADGRLVQRPAQEVSQLRTRTAFEASTLHVAPQSPVQVSDLASCCFDITFTIHRGDDSAAASSAGM